MIAPRKAMPKVSRLAALEGRRPATMDPSRMPKKSDARMIVHAPMEKLGHAGGRPQAGCRP